MVLICFCYASDQALVIRWEVPLLRKAYGISKPVKDRGTTSFELENHLKREQKKLVAMSGSEKPSPVIGNICFFV